MVDGQSPEELTVGESAEGSQDKRTPHPSGETITPWGVSGSLDPNVGLDPKEAFGKAGKSTDSQEPRDLLDPNVGLDPKEAFGNVDKTDGTPGSRSAQEPDTKK